MTQKQVQKIRKGLACCSQSEPACPDCPYIDTPNCASKLAKEAIGYIEDDNA